VTCHEVGNYLSSHPDVDCGRPAGTRLDASYRSTTGASASGERNSLQWRIDIPPFHRRSRPDPHRRCDRLHSARWRADARSLVHRRGKGAPGGAVGRGRYRSVGRRVPRRSGADLEAMQEMRPGRCGRPDSARPHVRCAWTSRQRRRDGGNGVFMSCPPVNRDCGKPLAPPVIRPRISWRTGATRYSRGHGAQRGVRGRHQGDPAHLIRLIDDPVLDRAVSRLVWRTRSACASPAQYGRAGTHDGRATGPARPICTHAPTTTAWPREHPRRRRRRRSGDPCTVNGIASGRQRRSRGMRGRADHLYGVDHGVRAEKLPELAVSSNAPVGST